MGRIRLENINKSFGAHKVLDGINLEIGEGELAVFVGPSGCGKSTLLRQISGLDKPTSGKVFIDGTDVTRVSAADRGLAMVFQSYALYPHMSVRQNLSFGLQNMKMARDEIAARIAEAARMLEIEPLMERRPGQLSGGQRQRVAIGRAIVRDPTAFLLDEPLSNLDAELRISMRAELAALHARLGATMIYVTHDQVEAMTLADRIVVLRGGRIEQVAKPIELFERPANRFVAGFIGAPRMNFLTPDEAAPLTGDAAPGATATVGIRPQHLDIGAGGLELTVTLVEALGTETVIHGALASGTVMVVTLQGHKPVAKGDKLQLGAPREMLHFFDGDDLRIEP
ncbi:MAG: sn-glycerol-3-phosphate ABC transporter ATP-binding protein UgpC [Maritimibacter sp.]|nr:sn-glycerol-3-phosphate ABC transporter ATP-binding protein UgpC [Maritimibacter sp.]